MTGGGSRRRRSALVAVALAAVVLAVATWSSPLADRSPERSPGESAPSPSTTPSPPDAPETSPQDASADTRLVFAHYFPPYPISLDNQPAAADYYTRNYLAADGEKGKHSSYGGLLRDRPLERAVSDSPDWRLEDLRTEVQQAKAAGIDGFTLDLLGLSGGNWEASVLLMQAASEVGGFTVVPNVDATAGIADASPAEVADRLSVLYAYSSAQVVDGEHLLSSFAAERRPPEWWQEVIQRLADEHDLPVKFVAVMLDASRENMTAFAPISYAFGNWGQRSTAGVERESDLPALAHGLGRRWMAPVAFQDARPREQTFAEAGNTETVRAMWSQAVQQRADLVQVVTWNDYSESTQIAPSMAHGTAFCDLTRFYAEWFRTGAQPAITSDRVFLTHRQQLASATPLRGPVWDATLGGATAPVRDTAEALVLLTAPAEVTVTAGGSTRTVELPAGIGAVTVPLDVGSVSAEVRRDGQVVDTLTSPRQVTAQPDVQDLQYWAVGDDA